MLSQRSDAVPHYAIFTYFGITIRKDLITKATAIFTSRLRVGQESVNILYSIKIALVAYILKAETSRLVRYWQRCCPAVPGASTDATEESY